MDTPKKVNSIVVSSILISIIASMVFGVLAWLVASNITSGFDESVLLWINQHANDAFDGFFVLFTELGGVIGVTLITIGLVAFLVYKKMYLKALLVAIVVGCVALLNIIIKGIFDRPRPDLWEWIVSESYHSFPSGHATASMALALCIVLLLWRTKWRILTVVLATIYVIVIGLSRLYLGVHFPTDILGGWLLGAAWASLAVGGVYVFVLHQRAVREHQL